MSEPMPAVSRARSSTDLPTPLHGVVTVWDRTLNSVWFGIGLMVALAVYIAVGSGLPAVRAWFELTDVQFFNAWPMRVLAGLLAVNLLTVSFGRIPMTLPRLGVWCIHIGIIVLLFGMVQYFSQKTEGLALVRTGETVNWYHDAHERALYLKSDSRKATPIPLPTLPRFKAYGPDLGNGDHLDDALRGLMPTGFNYDEVSRSGVEMPLHKVLEADGGEPITLDVVGFYPYAVVGHDYAPAEGELTGLRMTLRDRDTSAFANRWAVARQAGHDFDDAAEEQVATVRVRHVHRDDALDGDALLKAAAGVHAIEWHVGAHGDEAVPSGTITLQPGERKPLGETGYEVEAVAALPGFPLFGNGTPVDALELLVHPPEGSAFGKMFRRYVIDGVGTQTDFVLGVDGAGPKGERQSEPVDPALHLHYAKADGLKLLPQPGEDERHTILTKPDIDGFWHLVARNDLPARLEQVDDGELKLEVNGTVVDPATQQPTLYGLDLDIERLDGVGRREWVQIVPPEQRDRTAGESGEFSVVSVYVRRGSWGQLVHVPFNPWPDQAPWLPAQVEVPGVERPLQLQLGKTRRPMPARVTLDAFELVPYAGDFTPDSAMRDFRSHVTVEPVGGEAEQVTVKLNDPHYLKIPRPGAIGSVLPSESWLLFQSAWDQENQAFTVLGVGNRPGIKTMVGGIVLCVFGLMWAFYVKPAILRRRKERALAATGIR